MCSFYFGGYGFFDKINTVFNIDLNDYPLYFFLSILIVFHFGYHCLASKITIVTTSEEGIHPHWSRPFHFFDKIEKTIKWSEIIKFSVLPSYRIDEFLNEL